jgi:hypothetical protein
MENELRSANDMILLGLWVISEVPRQDMKVFARFRMAIRRVHCKILDMTKGLHLNHLSFNLTNVNRLPLQKKVNRLH